MSKIHDMIKRDQKTPVAHVQVAIPLPLYESVKRLLDESGLSWQKVLLASVKAFQIEVEEEKRRGSKK